MFSSLNPLLSKATSVKNQLAAKFNNPKSSIPTAKRVSSLTLQDIKNLDRPAPTWRWNLVLPPLPGIRAEQVSPNKSIFSFLNKAVNSTLIVCESIEIPTTINLGQQARFYNGQNVIFPGLPGFDTVTATFYETEKYQAIDYFTKWQKFVYDPSTQTYGVPADYGWTAEFFALPITDFVDVQRYMNITLRTCWPLAVQKLSYGNTTDRIKVQVEFAYHELEVNIVGGTASSSQTDVGSIINSITKFRS